MRKNNTVQNIKGKLIIKKAKQYTNEQRLLLVYTEKRTQWHITKGKHDKWKVNMISGKEKVSYVKLGEGGPLIS